jgi:hypothetical protein
VPGQRENLSQGSVEMKHGYMFLLKIMIQMLKKQQLVEMAIRRNGD